MKNVNEMDLLKTDLEQIGAIATVLKSHISSNTDTQADTEVLRVVEVIQQLAYEHLVRYL